MFKMIQCIEYSLQTERNHEMPKWGKVCLNMEQLYIWLTISYMSLVDKKYLDDNA